MEDTKPLRSQSHSVSTGQCGSQELMNCQSWAILSSQVTGFVGLCSGLGL